MEWWLNLYTFAKNLKEDSEGGEQKHIIMTKIEKEEWRDIKGFEGLYKINKNGEICSLEHYVYTPTKKIFVRERIIKHYVTKLSYHVVTLSNNKVKKLCQVHRLVYESFIGEIPEGMEIDHIDRNPSNNHLSNLRLVTRRGNMYNTKCNKEFPNVVSEKGKYRVAFSCKSKKSFGTYETIEEAIKVAQEVRMLLESGREDEAVEKYSFKKIGGLPKNICYNRKKKIYDVNVRGKRIGGSKTLQGAEEILNNYRKAI